MIFEKRYCNPIWKILDFTSIFTIKNNGIWTLNMNQVFKEVKKEKRKKERKEKKTGLFSLKLRRLVYFPNLVRGMKDIHAKDK